MVSKTVKVINSQGMHMRPAGLLAAETKNFPGCTVTLKTADKTAKASSVMQIMAAGLKCGTKVEITAEGEKEQEALDRIAGMFEDGFGE